MTAGWVDDLIAAFAGERGVEGVRPDASGAYVLGFDDTRVTFAAANGGTVLLKHAAIDDLPDDGCEEFCRALLGSPECGGATFALEPGGDTLYLQRVDDPDGLDLAGFKANLNGFLELVERTRGLIATYASVAAERRREQADPDWVIRA